MDSFSQKNRIKDFLDSSKEIPLKTLRHLSSADTSDLILSLNQKKSEILFQNLLKANLAVSTLSEMKEPHLKKPNKRSPYCLILRRTYR